MQKGTASLLINPDNCPVHRLAAGSRVSAVISPTECRLWGSEVSWLNGTGSDGGNLEAPEERLKGYAPWKTHRPAQVSFGGQHCLILATPLPPEEGEGA